MILPRFDPAAFGDDIDAYFAGSESQFTDITPGTAKRVVWAGEAKTKTATSVLYIHGFSATSEEIRPVPDHVAKHLGANLVFTRLTGHGRGGAAMATATMTDWLHDTAEALAAAKLVGDQVIVIATSTGGTLAALAALDGDVTDGVKGIALVSPNFALTPLVEFVLNLPLVKYWGPVVLGKERNFTPHNPEHEQYWTTRYPSVSVFPMVQAVQHFHRLDASKANVPALFMYSNKDRVVSPKAIKKVAQKWGGPVKQVLVAVANGDDPNSHVIAGDILSPGTTDKAVENIVRWVDAL